MVGQRLLHWACRRMALWLTATVATLPHSPVLMHKCGGKLNPLAPVGLPVTANRAQD